ncbi:MAG: hypothetical protein ABI596_14220 [Pyrinomonadaceae bacterium]
MTRQNHFAGKLAVTAFLLLIFSNWNKVPATLSQQRLAEQPIPVDYLQVPELPLSISMPAVEKTEKGYLLRCSAANSSSEQLLGVTFLILVLDPENKVRGRGSWSSGVRVPAYATTRLSIKLPLTLSIKSRYRVVLAPEQLIGSESIWQVMKARELTEAYARGDEYVMPKVRRVANQVDPPTVEQVIY